MSFGDHYAFRSSLVEALFRDLVGPLDSDAQNEVIADPPITRYVAGILYPQDSEPVDPGQDGDPADDGDEATHADPPVAMANVRYPSSMGLTFAVDTATADSLRVQVTTARYEPLESDSSADRWRRIPVRCEDFTFPVREPGERREALTPGLKLFYRVRPADSRGVSPVTVVLLNDNKRPKTGMRDSAAFFQPRIRVTAVGRAAAFVSRPSSRAGGSDEDVNSNRLLYRHRAAIAVGHGCSVEWETDSSDTHRAVSVSTCIIPQYDLLLSDSNPAIDTRNLAMKKLAYAERAEVVRILAQLLAGYRQWIRGLRRHVATLDPELVITADKHIRACREALCRMRAGLVELRDKADIWEAFRLANQAMLQQRARSVWLRSDRSAPEPPLGEEHRWRPFQLAFILLCIESIGNPRSQHRDMADLLWFPTGGGKTEAYLGLIAFTVFLRRLRGGDIADGVTVIMRYTLRLLTIQQFERAALLICCCEEIRTRHRSLGRSPIAIGLWVGRGGTPNSLRDARIALDKLRRGDGISLEESNPVQLQACPWCGSPLDPIHHYYITQNDPQLVIACKNQRCSFRNGLPVFVVDEDVYRRRPTLLVATADKFASLPWREQVAAIFNRNSAGSAPPELVIQDELHLISGPLGTLAGLYETAVDVLCSQDGVRPKVIASTATIRRAQSQARGLFDRAVRQFPPPGLDARDSYFAVEADRQSRGSRLYVGVMTPGVSQTTLLVRAYAALLQNASTLAGADRVRDSYWTLIGYFNSLRVLAGARMQVQDDVNERIGLLARAAASDPRTIDKRIELTSREPSGDIPSHLRRMGNALPHEDALDVILATNMISVGVDVDRLGLMVVMGQPQSTSEYIQATSRVGRSTPGLVVTLFNAARSRDRSHYESFVDYHSALYRQVESTSVTPFSVRARDRGLHAVVIALARLMIPEFRSNDSAAAIESHIDKLEIVKAAILQRVIHVDARESAAAAIQIDEIIEHWRRRAAAQRDLVFFDFQHPDRALLVDIAAVDDHSEDNFPTPWSLRDVDMASGLYLLR